MDFNIVIKFILRYILTSFSIDSEIYDLIYGEKQPLSTLFKIRLHYPTIFTDSNGLLTQIYLSTLSFYDRVCNIVLQFITVINVHDKCDKHSTIKR